MNFGSAEIVQTKNNSLQILSKSTTSFKTPGSSILNDLSTLESQLKSVMPSFNISLTSADKLRVRSKPYSVGNFLDPMGLNSSNNSSRMKVPIIIAVPGNQKQQSESETPQEVTLEKATKPYPSSENKGSGWPLQRSSSEYRIRAANSVGPYNQSSNPPSLEYLPHPARPKIEPKLETRSQEMALKEKQGTANQMNLSQSGWLKSSAQSDQKHKFKSLPDYSAPSKPDSSTIFYNLDQHGSAKDFQQPFRDVGLLKRYKISRAQMSNSNNDIREQLQHTSPAFFSSVSTNTAMVSAKRTEKDLWFAQQKLLSQSSRDRPRQQATGTVYL